MSRDDVSKNIDHLPPPPGFSDAECCLHCLHSEGREGSSTFLDCKKYKKRVEYLIGLFLGIVIALISPKGGSQWIQKQSLS